MAALTVQVFVEQEQLELWLKLIITILLQLVAVRFNLIKADRDVIQNLISSTQTLNIEDRLSDTHDLNHRYKNVSRLELCRWLPRGLCRMYLHLQLHVPNSKGPVCCMFPETSFRSAERVATT